MKGLPLLVGVTGGIGSGKSLVCAMLAGMGCHLFEADRVARELQEHDPGVINGIQKLFGTDIYTRDTSGKLSLDRKRVAATVFSDPGKLKEINNLVHPKVFAAFDREIERCRREGVPILCKEAAIIFESGREADLDLIVVVAAADEVRIVRAVARGAGTREEVIGRMRAQWPQERLLERADFVIWNEGSVDELRARTGEVYHKLAELVASGNG